MAHRAISMNCHVTTATPAAAAPPAWRPPQWRDTEPTISVRRKTVMAVALTVLMHLLLLLGLYYQQKMRTGDLPNQTAIKPIYLTLNASEAPKAEQSPTPEHDNQPRPRAITLPKPKLQAKPVEPPPQTPIPVEDLSALLPPPAAKPAPSAAPEAVDMATYVQAMREKRRAAAQVGMNPEDAPPPSADEIRMANIRRNLQPGTNGVFQILHKDIRHAEFSFRGWTYDPSRAKREVIEVTAGPGADIEREIVRKMIELIRRYYQGNFNFESARLGRTIVLSARLEDTAGLEDFLMKEFFNPNRPTPGY